MAAVVSRPERAQVASSGPIRRIDVAESRLLSLRLPQSEIDTLRMLFGGLESMVGLASRFGEQMTILAARAVTVCRHSEDRDACLYCRRRHACQLCGRCTRCGAENEEHMAIGSAAHASGRKNPLSPLPVEAWACWSNRVDQGLGRRVREAREALVEMADTGRSSQVNVLYRMYAGAIPRSMREEFQGLDDLAVLATETAMVAAHVHVLTKRLREEHEVELFEAAVHSGRPGGKTFEDLPRHIAASRLRVGELEALRDLWHARPDEARDKAKRLARAETRTRVRREAHTLLIEASNAYRSALG